eukprot:scaffold666904_cov48-Prasinocladus_malaysianus.AAC.1
MDAFSNESCRHHIVQRSYIQLSCNGWAGPPREWTQAPGPAQRGRWPRLRGPPRGRSTSGRGDGSPPYRCPPVMKPESRR